MPATSTPPGPSVPDNEQLEPVADARPVNSDAPVSFVPHTSEGAVGNQRVKIQTGRFGELEAHEIVSLLSSIEDERARGRFRESIYISFFVWLAVAWFIFYGPRVLWHAPKLRYAGDVMKQNELAAITLPPLPRAPVPPPRVDANTLERVRNMTREVERTHAAPRPAPAPTPTPAPPAAALPSAPTPRPNLPAAPQPNVVARATPPVADAPLPSAPKPNFNNGPGTAGGAIQQAVRGAAESRGGDGPFAPSPRRGGMASNGAEILSDPQGVDFGPYIRRLLADVKRNWYPLLPEETQPPLSKQGETQIRFKIGPDGSIQGMAMDGSTHDDAINHSCWSAITSEGQFPPLPAQFHGPYLELRLHFLVNKGIE